MGPAADFQIFETDQRGGIEPCLCIEEGSFPESMSDTTVIVIGGGIAGLAAACELASAHLGSPLNGVGLVLPCDPQ